MKTRIKLAITLCALFLLPFGKAARSYSQNVGINSNGTAPDASALLDIDASGMAPKGVMIPRIALTSITDVSTIASPANSLIVYNTNDTMVNGNGVGYYSYCSSGCATTGWKFLSAADNGPGISGQVLTSQGPEAQVQWKSLSNGNGGSSGCADCITATSIGTSGTWATCRNSCVAKGQGWRLPTWEEETFIASGALGTPTGGWISDDVWTSTPADSRINSGALPPYWISMNEANGYWVWKIYNDSAPSCRCVK